MTNESVVVAVGGGIAAYKSATLVSRLVQHGFDVSVVMTESSKQFVGASTFSALCGRPPAGDLFDARYPLGAHIELATHCRLLIVAPATARILASCAQGLADDLLATLYLNVSCPVLMAPAMSNGMWEKAAVRRNVAQLTDDGIHWVGPEEGWLSCRNIGPGRMAEPEAILATALELLQVT